MSNETIMIVQEIEQEAVARLLHAGLTPHERGCENILYAEQFGVMHMHPAVMRFVLEASMQAEADADILEMTVEPAMGALAIHHVDLVLAGAEQG